MNQRTYTILLSLIVALAMIPRLWLWFDQGNAGMVYPGDQDEYYRGAIHILLQGNYYDDGQWLRPPLMSLFLAGIFALVGVDVPLALLVQCVLSAATLPLLAEIARRTFTSMRAGVVAALLAALFLPYASYASQLFSETLFIFTITTALLLFDIARERGMHWHWLLAGGIAWGLAALTRPVGVYALPLLVLWAIWQRGLSLNRQEREDRTESHAKAQRRKGRTKDRTEDRTVSIPYTRLSGVKQLLTPSLLMPPLAIVLGFGIVVAPWSIRNYMVYNHFVLVDTNGGMSFWLGNLLEPDERDLQFVWNETIPNSAERQQVAMARAIDNIKRDPIRFLARTRYKIVSLWQLDTRLFVGNAPIGITLDERSLAFAVASDVQYIFIMVLAVLGVVFARSHERSWTLLGWMLYGTLLSAVSLGHPRLRLPLMMAVFVYAALPLAHPRLLWQRIRTSSVLRKAILAGGCALLAFLFYANAYIPFIHSQYWLLVAKLGGGQPAIEHAIVTAPNNYLPYVALGDMLKMQPNYAAALDAYDTAVERAPHNTATHMQRYYLNQMLGNTAQAQDAMDAVAAVGWDNNQLYAWAWDTIPLRATDQHYTASDPAPGIVRGVYAAEHDGEYFYRWTMDHTQVRLGLLAPVADTSSTVLTLILRADKPDTPVTVSYEYSDVLSKTYDHLTTLSVGTSWQRFRIPLGDRGVFQDNPFDYTGIVDVRVPTHVVSPDEPYSRGVALAEATLEYVGE